jgi:hypothetical protein
VRGCIRVCTSRAVSSPILSTLWMGRAQNRTQSRDIKLNSRPSGYSPTSYRTAPSRVRRGGGAGERRLPSRCGGLRFPVSGNSPYPARRQRHRLGKHNPRPSGVGSRDGEIRFRGTSRASSNGSPPAPLLWLVCSRVCYGGPPRVPQDRGQAGLAARVPLLRARGLLRSERTASETQPLEVPGHALPRRVGKVLFRSLGHDLGGTLGGSFGCFGDRSVRIPVKYRRTWSPPPRAARSASGAGTGGFTCVNA